MHYKPFRQISHVQTSTIWFSIRTLYAQYFLVCLWLYR